MKRKPKWLELACGRAALVVLCLWVAGGLSFPPLAAAAAQTSKGTVGSKKAVTSKKVASRNKSSAKTGQRSRKKAPASESAAAPSPARSGQSFFGAASFYGKGFQGRQVATGERFDAYGMTAASNHVPLDTWVAVQRLDGERCVIVRVNDRMHSRHRVRVIDLSRGAAEHLRMISEGVVMVRVQALAKAPQGNAEATCRAAFGLSPDESCADCKEADARPRPSAPETETAPEHETTDAPPTPGSTAEPQATSLTQ